MDNTGLKLYDIERIRTVFSKFPQVEKVLLYGSRAMGNYRPASDIDLTLMGKDIDLSLQQKIELLLDDLLLPYKFDISIYSKISNPDFLHSINQTGMLFYEKES